MTPERRLRDTYPDLLADDADPALLRLVADLDAVSAATEPPSAVGPLITHALCERAAIRRPEAVPALRFLPARWQTIRGRAQVADPRSRAGRRAWRAFVTGANAVATIALVVILVAALALVLGGVPGRGMGRGLGRPAGSASPAASLATPQRELCPDHRPVALLDCVIGLNPDLQQVQEAGLFQEVNLFQEMEGFTVTVQRAYADANRILVGFTLEQPAELPADYSVNIGPITLTDSAGRTYTGRQSGVGYGATKVLAFDAAILPAGVRE